MKLTSKALPLSNDDLVVTRARYGNLVPGQMVIGGEQDPEGRYMVIKAVANRLTVVDLDSLVLMRWEQHDDGWQVCRRGPPADVVDQELAPVWEPAGIMRYPRPVWAVTPSTD